MKGNNENIDKIVRDELYNRQFEGPPQDFLNDLNKRLDERDKKGFFGPWNGILDVILILLLAIYPFLGGSDQLTADPSQSFASQEQQDEKLQSSKSSSSRETQDIGTIQSSKNRKNALTASNGSKSSIGSDSENNSKNNNRVIQSKNQSLSASNSDSNGGTDVSEKSAFTGQNNKGTGALSSNQRENGDQDNSGDAKDNNSHHKNTNTEHDAASEPKHVQRSNHLLSNSQVYASQYPILQPQIRNWDFPPIGSSRIKQSNTESESEITKRSGKSTSPFDWEIQLSSGVHFPQLTPQEGANGSELALYNQSGTTPSYTIGGRVTIWYNNFSLSSGVDFLSMKEENLFEFEGIETYDSSYVSNVDTTVIYDSLQPIDTTYTYYYDTATVTDTTVSRIPVNQQYTWLQIPLQFGYQFRLNKWAFIPRAGINLAIGVRQTEKNYPNETFDKLQSYNPSTRVLLNLNGSLEVRRKFGNWHIFARGDYQTGMRPVLTGDYFDRKYSGFRINLGIGLTLK